MVRSNLKCLASAAGANRIPVGFLLLALFCLPQIQGSPVFYNLNFSFGGGTTGPPPTGSFSYDSSLSINPFSNFIVNYEGFTIDATVAANGGVQFGYPCGVPPSADQSAANLFFYLTTCPANAVFYNLRVSSDTGNGLFNLIRLAIYPPGSPTINGTSSVIFAEQILPSRPARDVEQLGTLTANPVEIAVPEPSSAALVSIAIILLVLLRHSLFPNLGA